MLLVSCEMMGSIPWSLPAGLPEVKETPPPHLEEALLFAQTPQDTAQHAPGFLGTKP